MLQKAGNTLEKVFEKFIKGSDIVNVVCLCGIILNYGVMIVLRSCGINYRAMEETVLLLAVWSYAIGAYEGTYSESHISACLIQTFLKTDTARYIHKLILDVISLFICVLITLWTVKWLQWAVPMRARSTVYGYPLYWRYFATLFMYGISIFFFARSCIKDIKGLAKKAEKDNGGAEE